VAATRKQAGIPSVDGTFIEASRAMPAILRDLMHAWRVLKQRPGFLAAALFTLAVGIGAMRPSPY